MFDSENSKRGADKVEEFLCRKCPYLLEISIQIMSHDQAKRWSSSHSQWALGFNIVNWQRSYSKQFWTVGRLDLAVRPEFSVLEHWRELSDYISHCICESVIGFFFTLVAPCVPQDNTEQMGSRCRLPSHSDLKVKVHCLQQYPGPSQSVIHGAAIYLLRERFSLLIC